MGNILRKVLQLIPLFRTTENIEQSDVTPRRKFYSRSQGNEGNKNKSSTRKDNKLKNSEDLESPTFQQKLRDIDRKLRNHTDSPFCGDSGKQAKEKHQKKLLVKNQSDRRKKIKNKPEVKKPIKEKSINKDKTRKVKFGKRNKENSFIKDININITFPYPVVALDIPIENKSILDNFTPLKQSETDEVSFKKFKHGKENSIPNSFDIFEKNPAVKHVEGSLISSNKAQNILGIVKKKLHSDMSEDNDVVSSATVAPSQSPCMRKRVLTLKKSTRNVGEIMAEEGGVLVYNTEELGNTECSNAGRDE